MSICVTQSVQMSYHYNDKFIKQTYKNICMESVSITKLPLNADIVVICTLNCLNDRMMSCMLTVHCHTENYTQKGSVMYFKVEWNFELWQFTPFTVTEIITCSHLFRLKTKFDSKHSLTHTISRSSCVSVHSVNVPRDISSF